MECFSKDSETSKAREESQIDYDCRYCFARVDDNIIARSTGYMCVRDVLAKWMTAEVANGEQRTLRTICLRTSSKRAAWWASVWAASLLSDNNNNQLPLPITLAPPLIDIDRYTLLYTATQQHHSTAFFATYSSSQRAPQPSPDRVPSKRYRNAVDW